MMRKEILENGSPKIRGVILMVCAAAYRFESIRGKSCNFFQVLKLKFEGRVKDSLSWKE